MRKTVGFCKDFNPLPKNPLNGAKKKIKIIRLKIRQMVWNN